MGCSFAKPGAGKCESSLAFPNRGPESVRVFLIFSVPITGKCERGAPFSKPGAGKCKRGVPFLSSRLECVREVLLVEACVWKMREEPYFSEPGAGK